MRIKFFKYQGAGNDFVMIDDRKGVFPVKNKKYIKTLCDRRFGIGADGMILLRKSKNIKHAFSMVYANSDGSIGSMCGNGGRCIVRFAHDLGIIKKHTPFFFDAVDGLHEALMKEKGVVELKMIDMQLPVQRHDTHFTHCGTTPHYITFVEGLESYPLKQIARTFRDSVDDTGGINFNIVEKLNATTWRARTYERGVEDETYACGTGACSIATILYNLGKIDKPTVAINMPGGLLKISFTPTETGFHNVWLTGPTEYVFEGSFEM